MITEQFNLYIKKKKNFEKRIIYFMNKNNILRLEIKDNDLNDSDSKIIYEKSINIQNYIWKHYDDGSGCLINKDLKEVLSYDYESQEYFLYDENNKKNYYKFDIQINEWNKWILSLEKIFKNRYIKESEELM